MLAKSGGQNLVPGCFELELEIAAWSLSRCTQEAQSNATYSFGTTGEHDCSEVSIFWSFGIHRPNILGPFMLW